MRISDHDRQRVADELGRHLAEGRIDIDGYSDRIAEVLGAETLADVDHARRDLPFMRIALPAGAGDGQRLPARRSLTAAGRWSRLTLVLAAMLVLASVVVAVVGQVAWVALLVGGWILGVAQGRAARHRR